MQTIYDSSDMERILSGAIDPDLKTILLDRLELLAEYLEQWALEDLLHVIVVETGDSIDAIARELGVNPLVNIVDNAHYPQPSFEPSFEFCIARIGYFDLTFALCDSGLGLCLLVPDRKGVVPQLLELCREYATL